MDLFEKLKKPLLGDQKNSRWYCLLQKIQGGTVYFNKVVESLNGSRCLKASNDDK